MAAMWIDADRRMVDRPAEAARFPRGRFWRRSIAFALDLLIIGMAIDLTRAALAAKAGAAFEPIASVYSSTSCRSGSVRTGPGSPPVDFSNRQRVLVRQRIYFPVGASRSAVLINSTRSGAVTHMEYVSYPVDAAGTLQPFGDGPSVAYAFALLALAASEAILGAGPGKLLLGLGVRAADGSRATARRVSLRNALRFLPFILAVPGTAYQIWQVNAGRSPDSTVALLMFAPSLVALGLLRIAPWLRRGPDRGLAPYDRLAGTDVFRVGARAAQV